MSDLQCPARVLLARHAESVIESDVESALESARSGEGAVLTPRGVAQAGELAERLRAERIACVYTSPMLGAQQTGRIVASALGVPLRLLPGVEEPGVEETGGEETGGEETGAEETGAEKCAVDSHDGRAVVARVAAALGGVADAHRGESVLVVSHGGVMSLALPWLVDNPGALRHRPPPLDHCAVVALEHDADGWRLIRG